MVERILLGAALPAFAAGAVLLASWRRHGTLGKFGASAAGALALAGGYALGHIVIAGMPSFPPPSHTDWMVGFAILAAMGGMLVTLARVSDLLVVAAVPWLLLAPLAQHPWSREETALQLTGLSFALLGLWIALEALSRHARIRELTFGLLLTTLAASTSLALSGSFLLAQLAGALAATLGAALVVTLVNPALRLSGGAVAVIIVIAGALLMSGHYYAELPAPSGVLVALSFVTPWVAHLPGPMSPGRRALVYIAAAIVPAAVAVGLAVAASPSWGSG